VQFAITDCVALVREVADHQVRILFDYEPYSEQKKIVEKCFYVPVPYTLQIHAYFPHVSIFVHGLGFSGRFRIHLMGRGALASLRIIWGSKKSWAPSKNPSKSPIMCFPRIKNNLPHD
jgi:hypothetical protein